MSFFEEGDEPRRTPRPRQPAGGAGLTVDQQTMRVRQGVAVGVGLLVVILLVVGIKGCLNSAKERSLRDYNRAVSGLIQESDNQVSKPFFDQLSGQAAAGTAGSPLNLETQVNQLRVVSEDLVKRARGLDVPGDVRPAQGSLLLVLELRRDALKKIASKLSSAQGSGSGAQTAVSQITGQMEAFLASDVIYSQRVIPYIKKALDDNSIGGQTIATSQFLPSISWLDESTVAQKLGASVTGAKPTGPVAPGSHGHALSSVSVGDTTLDSGSANRIPASASLTFNVKVANQGENNESNVVVKVSITGSGKPVNAQATIPQTSAGAEADVQVPLKQAPPIGVPVTINISIDPVPGEKTTDNNKESYPALFTRG